MCTVSYVPIGTGFVITSNRDEKETRGRAIVPTHFNTGVHSLLYPADAKHGGTWIAAKNNGDAAVLLNGAFEKHEPRAAYGSSRGLVFLDLLSAASPADRWKDIALENIEPFTMIAYTGWQLFEWRWDGTKKHSAMLPTDQAYIWSSVTLYDAQARRQRELWFESRRRTTSFPDSEAVLDFHMHEGKGDHFNGLVINRGAIKTQSITQMEHTGSRVSMHYHDLASQSKAQSCIDVPMYGAPKVPVSSIRLRWRCLLIRLRHWEFWPFAIVYGPIMAYWLWLSFRARSFFFFNAANPSIENGGFVLERKHEIYDLIPVKYIPQTLYIPKQTPLDRITERIDRNGMAFPLIAKPDIGLRGMGVKLLHDTSQLEAYVQQSAVDFLVQSFVPFPNEIGIFYCRIPGEERGQITGIVGKEFLSVTGDGASTVGELLLAVPRYVLQYQAIRKEDPRVLSTVPRRGKVLELVPYGNHARGARFIDLSHRADAILTDVIDDICRQVPGFYFGRLDIRYRSWEELLRGENVVIIELNGAGSEPAHIYDPSHTISFAWTEITRHWQLLARISRENHKQERARYLSLRHGIRLLAANRKYTKSLSS